MPPATDSPRLTSWSPRFAALWAAAVYLAALIALGYPALGGAFLVNPRSDQYFAGYAFRDFAAQTLRDTGHFPLWNPYLLGGLPYVAAMHGDIFYPTFLLRLVLPTDVAMTWGMMIHIFLAGWFTYFFLRSLGLGFFAALVGGLAYMIGGNVAAQVSPGHDGKIFVSALLPLALLLVTRGIRDGKQWAFGALAFVVGMAVLTPHPQLLQYMLLTCGAFGLFLAFADPGTGRLPRAVALRRLALAGAAVVVGLAIGAIQFLPVLKYVGWSPRAAGKGWADAVSYSLPPEEMVNFIVPQFSGILDLYWGRNGIHLHSEYLGVAVLLLATLALSRSWTTGNRRTIAFWAGTFVVSLLWALGGFTPFYRLVYALVPGTKFFRAPSTMLFLVSFSAAVLAAFGMERALRSGVSRRFLISWVIAAAVLALLGISGALTNLAVTLAPPGTADMAQANDSAIRFGTLRTVLFLAFTLATLFLWSTRRLGQWASGALLAAVVAVDLWSVARIYWIFSPPATELFATNAIVDSLKAEHDPFRVLPLALRSDQIAPNDPFLLYDGLMVHRIRSATGYHGNELGRYQELLAGDQIGAAVFNPNFWALENVRFILSANGGLDTLGLPGVRRTMGPVRDVAGSELFLYRISRPTPAAWVAPVIVKAADPAVLSTILDPRFDVRRAALFDTAAAVTAKTINALPDTLALQANVTRYEPGAIDVELDHPAPAGSALVMSENFYPGWSATTSGRALPIGRVDLTLIGVELPAGTQSVSLRYSSDAYRNGKFVTVLALLVALVWWGGAAFVGRRARE